MAALHAPVGNYRQHVGFAGALGVAYAWATHTWAGLHWLYGSTAALLTTIGGVLPDIDHPLGVEIKTLATLLGTIGTLVVWRHFLIDGAELPIEAQLWVVIAVYLLLRIGSRTVFARVMVHRGIHHSLPTCLVWGALTYLMYPTQYHAIRVWMAGAVMLGFLSHLVLDEVCSVDLRGTRIKRSFGSALKLWAPSLLSTLAVYALLYFLSQAVLARWPDGPLLQTIVDKVPDPRLPRWPVHWQSPSWRPWPIRFSEAGAHQALPASIPRFQGSR